MLGGDASYWVVWRGAETCAYYVKEMKILASVVGLSSVVRCSEVLASVSKCGEVLGGAEK